MVKTTEFALSTQNYFHDLLPEPIRLISCLLGHVRYISKKTSYLTKLMPEEERVKIVKNLVTLHK